MPIFWDPILKRLRIRDFSIAQQALLNQLAANEFKVLYYEEIISGTSGTLAQVPTGATILLGAFPSGGNAVVETISNGKPTGDSPRDSGGNIISVTSFDASGNYTLSGTPSAYPVALVYYFKITGQNWNNVDLDYVIHEDDDSMFFDNEFIIQDNVDVTKRIMFQAGNLSTGVTATVDIRGSVALNQDLLTTSSPTFAAVNGLTLTSAADGFTIAGGTTPRTLTVTGGDVSLNQDLLTSSTPTFGGLTLTGALVESGTAESSFKRDDNDHLEKSVLSIGRNRADLTAPNSGFGAGLAWRLMGMDGTMVAAATAFVLWENNQTNDTTARDSQLRFNLMENGSAVTVLNIKSNGNLSFNGTTQDIWSIGSSYNYLTYTPKSTNGSVLSLLDGGTGGSSINFGTTSIRRGALAALDGSHIGIFLNATNSGTSVTERIRFLNTGDIGVNTTTPDVYSIGASHNHFTFKALTGSSNINIVGGGTSGSTLTFGTTTVKRAAIFSLSGSDLVFQTNTVDSGTGTSDKLRITAAGSFTTNAATTDIYSLGGSSTFFTLAALSGTSNANFVQIVSQSSSAALLTFGNTTIRRAAIWGGDGSYLAFYTNPTNSGASIGERARFLSNGQLLVGGTSLAADTFATVAALGSPTQANVGRVAAYAINSGSGEFSANRLGTYRGSHAAPTATQSADALGAFQWYGYGTSAIKQGAEIKAISGSTFTNTNSETYLTISVVPSSSTTLTEAWRIASTGNFSNTGTAGTGYIHLKAGVDTTTGVPIRLTAGTLTTGANIIAGGFEWDGTNLFVTQTTGPTRKTIAYTTDIPSVPTLANGTYTPTLTNVANLSASTAYECQYSRNGNVVTVSGKVDIDPTLTATSTQLGISLPVASNLGAEEDCAGTAFCQSIAGMGAAILGDATNNRAQLQFVASDITNQSMFFIFQYSII